MGWSFEWFSSGDSTFNYDFGVSFTADQQHTPVFNYGSAIPGTPDREAASAFFRDKGAIYHTYSAYARGIDLLNGTYNFIDISPLGRNEDPDNTQSWVRRSVAVRGRCPQPPAGRHLHGDVSDYHDAPRPYEPAM